MYVLGINLSHDRSACLLKDGRVVVAIAEERLDGVRKSTLYFPVRKSDQSERVPPFRAIAYCLDAEGIGIDDLDLVNNKVKHRESFRPYAPSVFLENAVAPGRGRW